MQKLVICFVGSLLIFFSFQSTGRSEQSVQSEVLLPSLLASDKYSEKLNDQVQIDLLAVSNPVWQSRWQVENKVQSINGRNPEYWWLPDGKRLEKVPFRRGKVTFGSWHFDFLVRIKGIEDFKVFAGHKDPAELYQVKTQPVVDDDRKPFQNLFIISVRGFPERGRVEKTTLKVGLTYGPWTFVDGWGGDWPRWAKQREGITLDSSCGALIEFPSQVGNNIHVDLVYRLVHEEIRLVATDQQDQVHVAVLENRGVGAGIVRQLCIFKNLCLEQLKTISVEKRDYQYVQFPDVVLEPKHVLPWTSYSAIKKQKGQDAPEFRQIKDWKNGGPYKIKELKGKVILLDFWNFACGSCLLEMPKLMDLHDRYADDGLVVIGIHADMVDSIEEMDQMLAKSKAKLWKGREIPFPVALDGGGKTQIQGTNYTTPGATTAAYGVQNFPTKILINKDGKLLGQFFTDTDDDEQQIKRLLEL